MNVSCKVKDQVISIAFMAKNLQFRLPKGGRPDCKNIYYSSIMKHRSTQVKIKLFRMSEWLAACHRDAKPNFGIIYYSG